MLGRFIFPNLLNPGDWDLGQAGGLRLRDLFLKGRVVPGRCPVFRAHQNVAQAIGSGGSVKVQVQAEDLDSDGCFDPAVNYRFLPNVAGYYHIKGQVSLTLPAINMTVRAAIWRNGAEYCRSQQTVAAVANSYIVAVEDIVLFNGTTDYVELYVFQNSGANQNTDAGSNVTNFSGALVRAT